MELRRNLGRHSYHGTSRIVSQIRGHEIRDCFGPSQLSKDQTVDEKREIVTLLHVRTCQRQSQHISIFLDLRFARVSTHVTTSLCFINAGLDGVGFAKFATILYVAPISTSAVTFDNAHSEREEKRTLRQGIDVLHLSQSNQESTPKLQRDHICTLGHAHHSQRLNERLRRRSLNVLVVPREQIESDITLESVLLSNLSILPNRKHFDIYSLNPLLHQLGKRVYEGEKRENEPE